MSTTSKMRHDDKNLSIATGEIKSELLEFFTDEIKDIYWAENHLVKTIPKMVQAATSEELKDALEKHLVQTKDHVFRLERIFGLLGVRIRALKCDAMEGIVEEGEEIIEETNDGAVTRDVGIIMAAQKVEHYEIATYGGLVQLARTIGREDIAEILAETLAEEKNADALLTEIAVSNINYEAHEEFTS